MIFNSKLQALRALFGYFGRSSFAQRQRLAHVLGWLAARLMRSRARIVRTNLGLAFPEQSVEQREAWLHEHFHLLAQSVVDRGVCWFGPADTIYDMVQIEGLNTWMPCSPRKRRIIMLAPTLSAWMPPQPA